jgi:hypothetical protein
VTTEPTGAEPDHRTVAAQWVRRQYADLARAGHPTPLAATQVEAAVYVRSRSKHLDETDSLAVLRGAMEALGELVLTGAPTVVQLPDDDEANATTTATDRECTP